MSKIVADFEALPLDAKLKAYPEIIASLNAAKRLQLEAEIKGLGFRPGEVKKPPASVKFRSLRDPSRTWAGRGAEPSWLVEEMKETGKGQDAFRVT